MRNTLSITGKARNNDPRLAAIEKRVSDIIKAYPRYQRYDVAKKFARKMRAHIARVDDMGAGNPPGDGQKILGRQIINAMSWGVGAAHDYRTMRRYEAAARAAERFCR